MINSKEGIEPRLVITYACLGSKLYRSLVTRPTLFSNTICYYRITLNSQKCHFCASNVCLSKTDVYLYVIRSAKLGGTQLLCQH
ncbi:hypothetical protein BABINDRAFT_124771 [Babjeviella inositovora NRRL Y-12698]|uniref:Uncharacterized protein n=1 Tax=Babjeviella inositovora NRRL Y-12698 TaxID=984486 RepID=A0A1E3QUF2_9ASCO|nr:uncharacterized protein BABINDRAFT_124771 [Babjeviella inositovora NRRL Y-12698]ODQ80547.1 hypothetical protein BABINDRAFT_124771 [Babjeviella inositovora NRRL Y-12698]